MNLFFPDTSLVFSLPSKKWNSNPRFIYILDSSWANSYKTNKGASDSELTLPSKIMQDRHFFRLCTSKLEAEDEAYTFLLCFYKRKHLT